MDGSDSPSLSMLWETVDPYATLDRRFGFSGPEHVAGWLRATLASHWGITVRRCERIVLSARNALAWLGSDAGTLLAKWSIVPGLHPRLAALAELTAWLHGRSLPVSPPLATLEASLQLATPKGSLGLQEVMDGDLLDPSDAAQVREAGFVLAACHAALAEYPHGALASNSGAWRPHDPGLSSGPGIRERVNRWLDSVGPDAAGAAVAFLRDRLVSATAAGLPAPQLVHNDIRSANILCRGSQVSALLDFEEVIVDYRVSDLAKAAVMLGTRFRNWAPLDPEMQRCFVEGYREFRCLSPIEEAWLPVLVVYRTLRLASLTTDRATWATAAERLAEQADPLR